MTATDAAPGDTIRSLERGLRRGAMWSSLDVAVSRLGNVVLGLVLARILVPADFGVFAVAIVVHSVIINISDIGVGTALVRDEADQVERSAPTVMTIAVVVSILLGLVMFVGAPLFADLLGSARARPVIEVMALNLPLAGLSAVPAGLLRRSFRNDKLLVADVVNLVVTYAVAVPLALHGAGPLALAWSWVASQAAGSAVLIGFLPRFCRPGFDRGEARRLVRFGLPLAGANVLGFSIQNVDYVVVGRMLGSTSLGLYLLAFNLSGWPMNVIGSVVRAVTLPALSRLREEHGDIVAQFAHAMRLIATITFPACLFLGAMATPVILGLYGPRWRESATALVGLAAFGAVRTILEPIQDYLLAAGRSRAYMLAQVPWLVALIPVMYLGVRWGGIAGAGVAQLVVVTVVVTPVYLLLVSQDGPSPRVVMGAVAAPLAWTGLGAMIAHLNSTWIAEPWAAMAVGGVAGLAICVLAQLTTVRELLDHVRGRRADPVAGPRHPAVTVEG